MGPFIPIYPNQHQCWLGTVSLSLLQMIRKCIWGCYMSMKMGTGVLKDNGMRFGPFIPHFLLGPRSHYPHHLLPTPPSHTRHYLHLQHGPPLHPLTPSSYPIPPFPLPPLPPPPSLPFQMSSTFIQRGARAVTKLLAVGTLATFAVPFFSFTVLPGHRGVVFDRLGGKGLRQETYVCYCWFNCCYSH